MSFSNTFQLHLAMWSRITSEYRRVWLEKFIKMYA